MPFLILKWFFPFFQGLLLGLVAMTLHEAGHLIAALAVGIKVKNVGFCWKGTVSYTHLDVYKRQVYGLVSVSWKDPAWTCVGPSPNVFQGVVA